MKDIKKFRENIIQIRAHVSERERMAVLAEEAAELADSAQVLLESITESRRGGRRWVFAEYARDDFGVACLRLYEHQGILNIENNLQDLEKFFLEISRFLLPI